MHRCQLAAALSGLAVSFTPVIAMAGTVNVARTITNVNSGYDILNPTWADEFDGTELDTSKWTAFEPNRKRRQGWNTMDQVSVNSGTLKIGTGNKITDPNHPGYGLYPTAIIGTHERQFFKYGYFETKVKLQTSPGNWSAFWLHNMSVLQEHATPDPENYGTEIDIFEHTIKGLEPEQKRTNHAIHYNGYNAGHKWRMNYTDDYNYHGHDGPRTYPDGSPVISPVDNNPDAWNTFGLAWTPDYYAFYINGNVSWVLTAPGTTASVIDELGDALSLSSEEMRNVEFYTVPHGLTQIPEFMLLSMEVADPSMHIFGGNPADGEFPDRVEFDYVRYYAGLDGSLSTGVPEPAAALLATVSGAFLLRRSRRVA